MDPKNLNSEIIYVDGIYMLSNVERLPDGRLFTIGVMPRDRIFDPPLGAPKTQLILGRISNDDGHTWETPYVMCELPDRYAHNIPAGFMISKSGRIFVYILHIFGIQFESRENTKGDIYYVRFDDETGRGMVYKKFDCLDRYSGSWNNGAQLLSGRLVVPFSTISDQKDSVFVSSVVYSDDDGETWKASNDLAVVSEEEHLESGAVEPVVVEVEPDKLVMLIRTVLGYFYYSVSTDGGETWREAKKTKIPSSNAPAGLVKLPNGKIVISWNDVFGEPMAGKYYSFARQCLHVGYSEDGLKTIRGGNIVLKKQKRDPDKILNCYPFANVASENEVFLRPFVVDSGDNEKWSEPTGYLMRLDPANLLSQDVNEDFSDGAARWVTKSEVENGMLAVRANENNIGYACLNFSFARKGNIEIKFDSAPHSTIIALSNYYIDKLSFTNNEQRTRFSSYLTSFPLSEKDINDGCFNIVWDKDTAYNHLYFIIPEDVEGTLLIKSVQIKTNDAWLDTGIEY